MEQPPPAEASETLNQSPLNEDSAASIPKIQSLLKAKDDTQRFVGLALLRSVIDNSREIRQDERVMQSLWSCISSKFLDRLLRTGCKPSSGDSKQMLDLVISVLHTFASLLPETSLGQSKFVDRIPNLVKAALYSSEETTRLLLQLLYTLASSSDGAEALISVEDLSPLTEIAPSHPEVLDALCYAFLNTMGSVEDKFRLRKLLDETIQKLAISFTATDAVTFLEFIGNILRQSDPQVLPADPKWITTAVIYIRKLVASRPNPEARSAYTNAAASLLQIYPSQTTHLLFTYDAKDEKPFPYLFINLLLIDIRSSAPVLLEQLNTPHYPKLSRRISSAFDVICIFIGYLVRSMDDESIESLILPPGDLLKLRKSISETVSVTLEYLRDRWDASVAGAMGLHKEARTGAAETAGISRHALTWDSLQGNAEADGLILSAIRASSLWLREDENEPLRKEATGLMDMFMDLYRTSSQATLDFRSSILVALEALVTLEQGRELLLRYDGWQILTQDLANTLRHGSDLSIFEQDVSRGTEIIRVLLTTVEEDTGSTPEHWMGLVTTVSGSDLDSPKPSTLTGEFSVALLQLCCALCVQANRGMLKRYTHTLGALRGSSHQLHGKIRDDAFLLEQMDDMLQTLDALSKKV